MTTHEQLEQPLFYRLKTYEVLDTSLLFIVRIFLTLIFLSFSISHSIPPFEHTIPWLYIYTHSLKIFFPECNTACCTVKVKNLIHGTVLWLHLHSIAVISPDSCTHPWNGAGFSWAYGCGCVPWMCGPPSSSAPSTSRLFDGSLPSLETKARLKFFLSSLASSGSSTCCTPSLRTCFQPMGTRMRQR